MIAHVIVTQQLQCRYDNSEDEDEDDDDMTGQDDLYTVALQPDGNKSSAGSFPDECGGMAQSPSTFFHRSESMTFLGCADPNTFEVNVTPLSEKCEVYVGLAFTDIFVLAPVLDLVTNKLVKVAVSSKRLI